MTSGPSGNSPVDIVSYLLFVSYGVVILTITACCQGFTDVCGYFLQRIVDVVCRPFRIAKAGSVRFYTCATWLCRGPSKLIGDIRSRCTGLFIATTQICRRACLAICDSPEHLKSATAAIAAIPAVVRASAWHFWQPATAAVLALPGQMLRAVCSAVSTFLRSTLKASLSMLKTLQQLLLTLLPTDSICTIVASTRLAKRFWHKSQGSHQVVLLNKLSKPFKPP